MVSKKKIYQLGLLIYVLFQGAACSYFDRKGCEEANWYQLGFDGAMKGQRPADLPYVQNCRKLEAEFSEAQLDQGFKAGVAAYCHPDNVFLIGKQGKTLNFDFCEPSQLSRLKTRHQEGVSAYCEKGNAYQEGLRGNSYTKICPADKEDAFMKEFQRGRRKFLAATILEYQGKMAASEDKIRSLRQDESHNTLQLIALPSPRTVVVRTYNQQTNAYTDQQSVEDPYHKERDSLKSKAETLASEIRQEEKQKSEYQSSIYSMQKELLTLQDDDRK